MTNRICLGRFLHAVANLKLAYGSPDVLDHTGAKVFYHRVVFLALATGVLGPRLSPCLMLAAEDALHYEFDAYEDCFDDETTTAPAGPAGCEAPVGCSGECLMDPWDTNDPRRNPEIMTNNNPHNIDWNRIDAEAAAEGDIVLQIKLEDGTVVDNPSWAEATSAA
jgi:hypothetical protein